MCGIAVAIDCDQPEVLVATAIGGLLHRGDVSDPIASPRPGSAMATRRLRIVDPAHAQQPMVSFDGALVVAFNGQIYNHVALRRELEQLGVRFKTHSDTEVLANALRTWGPGALARLNGMYAFVALKLDTGEFLAGRDPFGVKPLYLARVGGGYLFCSELRALLAAAPEGEALFLPPGHVMTKTILAPAPSWPASHVSPPGATDEPQALDRILADAVALRVPPDLPFGLLFSGGIDSTLIAHYARRVRPDAPAYFLGDAQAPDYRYAAAYAERTGLDLRLVPLELDNDAGGSLVDELVGVVETFEPEVVRTGLCSWLMGRAVHGDGLRVALCGEGADELFAGYRPLELAFAQDAELGQSLRRQCLDGMHRSNLQRVDRGSMRFQVETREPFLDPRVVDYALSLDPATVVGNQGPLLAGKAPLRRLYDLYPDELPQVIRDRSKAPFNEGAGMDRSQTESPWLDLAEQTVTDAEFDDARREFAAFDLRSKEEAMYLRSLAGHLDVWRVPHLKFRSRLVVPKTFVAPELEQFIVN